MRGHRQQNGRLEHYNAACEFLAVSVRQQGPLFLSIAHSCFFVEKPVVLSLGNFGF